ATVSTNALLQTEVTLTFSGPFTEQNPPQGVHPSLVDGVYLLTVFSDQVTGPANESLDGDANGAAGGDHRFATHRLFGDGNGDKDTDLEDLYPGLSNALYSVQGQANYNPA